MSHNENDQNPESGSFSFLDHEPRMSHNENDQGKTFISH